MAHVYKLVLYIYIFIYMFVCMWESACGQKTTLKKLNITTIIFVWKMGD